MPVYGGTAFLTDFTECSYNARILEIRVHASVRELLALDVG